MSQTTFTPITAIHAVSVPVADQDHSLRFFVEVLGFEQRMDAELAPGFRWIEVAPPGGAVCVAIIAASSTAPAGVDTGIRLVTADAEAAHAGMTDRGVEVGEMLRWPGVPPMFSFRDIDGNTFYLTQSDG